MFYKFCCFQNVKQTLFYFNIHVKWLCKEICCIKIVRGIYRSSIKPLAAVLLIISLINSIGYLKTLSTYNSKNCNNSKKQI